MKNTPHQCEVKEENNDTAATISASMNDTDGGKYFDTPSIANIQHTKSLGMSLLGDINSHMAPHKTTTRKGGLFMILLKHAKWKHRRRTGDIAQNTHHQITAPAQPSNLYIIWHRKHRINKPYHTYLMLILSVFFNLCTNHHTYSVA